MKGHLWQKKEPKKVGLLIWLCRKSRNSSAKGPSCGSAALIAVPRWMRSRRGRFLWMRLSASADFQEAVSSKSSDRNPAARQLWRCTLSPKRKLTGIVSKSKTCLIFINQIREKIGVMFGNPETTTGGRALKFYASVRADVRRIASIKDGDDVVGSRTKVKIVKNKVAPPFREAEFDIMYGEGISREGDLIDLGVDKNIIDKSGAWFSFQGERLGQGRENARQFLKDNPDYRGRVELALREIMGLAIPTVPASQAAAASSDNGHKRR